MTDRLKHHNLAKWRLSNLLWPGSIMNTFPMNNDEYSVEEISYDDMMSILTSKRAGNTDSHIEILEIAEPVKVESSPKPISRTDDQARFIERSFSRQDELARRISENANQQLPDWLLNN